MMKFQLKYELSVILQQNNTTFSQYQNYLW